MKKKIFSLLIILTMFLGFGVVVNAEIHQDSITVVVDITNMDDRSELYNLIESYNIEVDDRLYIHSISVYGTYAGEPLITVSDIALNGNPFIQNYGELGYYISSDYFDFIEEMVQDVTIWYAYDINGSTPLYYVITLPPLPSSSPSPSFTIFGFFENFYSNYIFPDNLLDTLTLNLITAVTTLMFFIVVFRGIWSIFRGRKK